jgi:hypothetical protein
MVHFVVVTKVVGIHSSEVTSKLFGRLLSNFPPVIHNIDLTLKISTTRELQPPTATISASPDSMFFTRAHTCPEREVGILGTLVQHALFLKVIKTQLKLNASYLQMPAKQSINQSDFNN